MYDWNQVGIGNRNQSPISVLVSELKSFSKTKTFTFKFFSFFPLLSWGYEFLKAWSLKMIWKYLKFGSKFGFKGPFVMEKIPHIIGNYILSLKYGFGIYRLRYWPHVSTKIVVLVVHYQQRIKSINASFWWNIKKYSNFWTQLKKSFSQYNFQQLNKSTML